MELNIVRKDDKSLLLEVKGESFTLTTPIKEKLWEDDNVIEAADMKEHPYLEEPKIWVKVERGSPLTALSRAASKLERDLEKLEEAFKKALKEF